MTPFTALDAGHPLAPFSLAGRTAVVTGAAVGLGRKFAVALAQMGAHVACVDHDVAGLRETVDAMGAAALAVVADISDEATVTAAAAAVAGWRGGTLDILVNNAGLATPPARLGEVRVDDWDRAISVNLRGVFLCTRAWLPPLLESGRGTIVNVASYLGLKGVYPGFPVTAMPYTASKAAIVGMTRQLAVEYAAERLRVNAIAPGWHAGTQLGRERRASATPDEEERFVRYLRTSAPLGRAGLPDELVALLLYLVSDASRYVTGQVIAHDGGQTAA